MTTVPATPPPATSTDAAGPPSLVPAEVPAGDGGYLTAPQIWAALQAGMVPGRTYRLAELYDLVASTCQLGPGDLEPESARTKGPRWQRNVRNVLHRRKGSAALRWDGRGGFTLR